MEKKTQKIYLRAAFLVPTSHNSTMKDYIPKTEFNQLMTEFVKE